MKSSSVFTVILMTILVLPACESAQQTAAPVVPGATLARATGCELFGGGIDSHAEIVPTDRNGRVAITIEPVSTVCDEEAGGIWFKVYSFLDDGTAQGRRIFLGSDHDPVVLRANAAHTEVAWIVNVDFVPPAEPFKLVAGFFPPLVVEAYGPGGKIGEITDVLNQIPDPGRRGPHLHGND